MTYTKTKLALWGMILLLSFSYAGTEKGKNAEKEAQPYAAKILKDMPHVMGFLQLNIKRKLTNITKQVIDSRMLMDIM
ncbi:MAG: hypothetical protein MK119_04515 [Kordia sp.]|jgi:hypothetical protein|nr:hypothetical protein [Kordia sp.]MCH2193377.1 hypothetical protein [Kordia sp.]